MIHSEQVEKWNLLKLWIQSLDKINFKAAFLSDQKKILRSSFRAKVFLLFFRVTFCFSSDKTTGPKRPILTFHSSRGRKYTSEVSPKKPHAIERPQLQSFNSITIWAVFVTEIICVRLLRTTTWNHMGMLKSEQSSCKFLKAAHLGPYPKTTWGNRAHMQRVFMWPLMSPMSWACFKGRRLKSTWSVKGWNSSFTGVIQPFLKS